MQTEIARKTGIPAVGDIAWGTHFCHFYQTRQDMYDLIFPYLQAGLESYESCIWIITEALSQETMNAVRLAIPSIDRHLAAGDIEIILYSQWYLEGDNFDPQRIINGWNRKLTQALAKGYVGLRVAADAAWLGEKLWAMFAKYEKEINHKIANQRIIALCAYPLEENRAAMVFDVIHTHQFAIAQRYGRWEIIETTELKQVKAALEALNNKLEQTVDERTAELARNNESLRREIAERKEAVQSLHQSTEKHRELEFIVDQSPAVAFLWKAKGWLVEYVSENIQQFGYTPDDFYSGRVPYTSIVHPDDLQRVEDDVMTYSNEPDRKQFGQEYRIVSSDGQTFWIDDRTWIRRDDEGKITHYQGIVIDITKRKMAEEALRERESFIRCILDSVDEGFIVVDREYRMLSVNKAFCNLMKLPEDSVIGGLCYEILRGATHPCCELGEECLVKRTFETGTTYSVTHEHKNALGMTHYIELKSHPITDGSGSVVWVIETGNDVTEKRRLEGQLRQAQKMEAIGHLAGGVAHDFNNMLGVILGHTELAMMQLDSMHPLLAHLVEIQKAGEHSADLTRQLLAFARKQTISPQVLDLNKAIEKILNMLRRLIGEDINLVWIPAFQLWAISIDPTQVDQILANLCVNARNAIAGVGKVTIETSKVIYDETYCASNLEVIRGEYVLLAVSDDGCGMNKETLSRLFEPFFTTKEMGRGTGLGLATVYGIVKQNNGFINAYSEPGHGTSFKIYLPRHTADVENIRQEKSAAPTVEGHETILLVEDDPAVLKMTMEMLEIYGYRTLIASIPSMALRVAKEYGGEIHLLITDVVMPEMNGQDLSKNLLSLYPGIRCLFMSGYTGNVIVRNGVLDNDVHFIQKPFSMQNLASKVREVLDNE